MWSSPGQGVSIIDGQYDTPYIRWDVACKQDVQVALGKGFPPQGSIEQQHKLAYLVEQQVSLARLGSAVWGVGLNLRMKGHGP